MATTFRPVTLEMVEEGRLLHDLEEQFRDLQAQLVGYVRQHGEISKGAKAKLALAVTLRVDHVPGDQCQDDATYSITSDIRATLPVRPKRASIAMSAEDDYGQQRLFCRASGTTGGEHPRQRRLTTEDGDAVDPETGEVISGKRSRGRAGRKEG